MEYFIEELSNKTDHFAIEWLQSYGGAIGQDVLQTCRAVGRFEAYWGYDNNIYRYARPTILAHITGGVRGKKKSAIRQSLMLRFGGTKKGEPLHGLNEHERDAMAAAVYHQDGLKLGASDQDWARQ